MLLTEGEKKITETVFFLNVLSNVFKNIIFFVNRFQKCNGIFALILETQIEKISTREIKETN